MSELEAHAFSRGHAYRFGGDEYVLILPNASIAEAVGRLHRFQVGLNALRFPGTEKSLAVSIGAVDVSDDCPLTDGEVEERAAHAKQYAKDHGKNCIGGYNGPFYSDDELEIITAARGG